MATTVTITGTGIPIPSASRAGPGVLVQSGDLALQFDAGRSTVQRLTAHGVKMRDLDAVFLTHHHSDHLTGLQDIILTHWVEDHTGALGPLPIVAPAGPAIDFAERMLSIWVDDIAVRRSQTGRAGPTTATLPFELGDTPVEVWSRNDVRVLAGKVLHDPVLPSVGYRIETPDGVVAISGDTVVCDGVAALAAGADILVYEALRREPFKSFPPEMQFIVDSHADTKEIGVQAAQLGIRSLILTHLVPEPQTEEDRQAFVDDVRAGGFDGELLVANDLDSVKL